MNNESNKSGQLLVTVFLGFVISTFLVGCSKERIQTNTSSLKPVVGAFGWKLGDKLPEQFKSEVHDGRYSFKPETEVPPFYDFELQVTEGGQICSVTARGSPKFYEKSHEDFYDCKQRLISVLTEKYGLQQHKPKGGLLEKEDEYDFGNEDQVVQLLINSETESFTLEYFDKKLQRIALDERWIKKGKIEDEKKAALSKGL